MTRCANSPVILAISNASVSELLKTVSPKSEAAQIGELLDLCNFEA
jgi:hypothetical protein